MSLPRIARPNSAELFGDNKMKLGTFGANVSNGCAATTAEGGLELDWPTSRQIIVAADQAGFELQVPVARWRGFGGATDFNGTSFETLVWAAGMGSATQHTSVFSTTHVPTIHPVLAAKQCVTADHATNGRFGLNVVCGWVSQEMRMFGPQTVEHPQRYDYAAEWLEIVRLLWTAEEPFDFEGRYFTVTQGMSRPQPLQAPHPPIMNAGGSEIGARFAAKHADLAFVGLYEGDFAANQAQIREIRRIAREDYARSLQVWANCWVVCRPTEKEAAEYAHYYIYEKGDWAAVDNLTRELGIQAAHLPPERLDRIRYKFLAGWGGLPLIGTPAQIVDQLSGLSAAGLDGVVLSWVNYRTELAQWRDEVLPLMEQAGLRKPFRPDR